MVWSFLSNLNPSVVSFFGEFADNSALKKLKILNKKSLECLILNPRKLYFEYLHKRLFILNSE
jgi:hypothetical protein